MTNEELTARAREALDGTTPGPWEIEHHRHRETGEWVVSEVSPVVLCEGDGGGGVSTSPADAAFIAAAPTLVADLADEVERLEAWRAEALAMNARLQDLGIALGVALDSLDRVRKALSGHPACDVHPGDDPITCGWKRAVADIRRALDGAR